MAPGPSGLGITLRGRPTCGERAAEKCHVAFSEPPHKRGFVSADVCRDAFLDRRAQHACDLGQTVDKNGARARA